MGSGRWDPSAYATYSARTIDKPVKDVFSRSSTHKDLDPKGVIVRESRDSADNPLSSPIIVALDVTGSMGEIARKLATEGLGTLFQEILDRKPVTDPHMMFMAVGDVKYDDASLQVSQFEADSRIIEQLSNIYVESGGGGNHTESYNLPWYFAAFHTSIDSFEKRGKKGYLFTVGDEEAPLPLQPSEIKQVTGDEAATAMDNRELLDTVSRMYHVFHIVVEQGNHARHSLKAVMQSWTDTLGQRVLRLADYTKLSEVIVSTIQVIEGADKAAVAASWKGDTSLVVAQAIDGLVPAVAGGTPTGVHRF